MTAEPRYEIRDADVRWLLLFGLSLVAVVAAVMLLVAPLMTFLAARQPAGPPASPLAPAADLPPEPRLQTTPRRDLAEKRRAEDGTLTSYAWIDRSNGIVRIPIDRAMELLAERAQRTGAETEEQRP